MVSTHIFPKLVCVWSKHADVLKFTNTKGTEKEIAET